MSLYYGDPAPDGTTMPDYSAPIVGTSNGRTKQIMLAVALVIAFAIGWFLYRRK